MILFIYRDVVYPQTENEKIAEVIIGKNRHGPTATVQTLFEGKYTRFENLSKRDGDWIGADRFESLGWRARGRRRRRPWQRRLSRHGNLMI